MLLQDIYEQSLFLFFAEIQSQAKKSLKQQVKHYAGFCSHRKLLLLLLLLLLLCNVNK